MPTPPDLKPQFKKPKTFKFHSFTREGRKIRFGSAFPKDEKPEAIIIVLPGLSEFIEKYYETARDLLEQNFGVVVIDWFGQGKSGRYFEKKPHKRHSAGFDEDLKDLHALLSQKLPLVLEKAELSKSAPLAMLGHSMGAHLGMRYLARKPESFLCAGFSAPMLGVQSLPPKLSPLVSFFNTIASSRYAFGQKNWTHKMRENAGADQFSTDPVRGSLHNAWCLADPDLQVGGVTFAWVHEALESCAALEKQLPKISTHCLVALAGGEEIVSNEAIQRAILQLPDSVLMELLAAKHEILMERDEIRNLFLKSFIAMVKTHIIELSNPEELKL